jgi:hypothetical protein
MPTITTSEISNPDSHPNEFDGIYEITCSGADATVADYSAGNISVTWNCTIDSSGTCIATTDCQYAGFSTTCSLDSTFDSGGWSGSMIAGDDGNLPPGGGSGLPIEVSFDSGPP